MNSWITTIGLLTALKTQIAAIELSAGVPLFQKVEIYRTPNLIHAIQDLKIYRERICLLVPSSDQYQSEFVSTAVQTKCTRSVELLLSDRDAGNQQAASSGNANTPGVLKMKDLVEEALLGQNLNFKPMLIRLRPESGEAFVVKEKGFPDREGWHMTWLADVGARLIHEKRN